MSSVRLEHIYKSYGPQEVLRDINLEILDGEFLVLVGPSGCGKSTTLRHVAGLEDPTSGEIFISDQNVTNLDPAKRDIAMVFQNYALYPHMNVFDNMAFGLKIRKINAPEIKKRVCESAEILKIEDLLDRKPKELSGGQRQRVALGRALVRDPKVFLFDEPLSNLDAKLRSEMRIEIKRLHQILKTTMIYVTHDQTEAMTMGDRIAIMNNGIIEQLDTPLNAYNSPQNKFVAGFIGMPQMNFIEGNIEIEGNGVNFLFNDSKLKFGENSIFSGKFTDGQEVTLGVRPEDILERTSSITSNNIDYLTTLVEITEPLGSNLLVHLKYQDLPITASFRGNILFKPGDEVDIGFDVERLHLFAKDRTD